MLRNVFAGLGWLFSLLIIAKPAPPSPNVDSFLNRSIQCFIKQDAHTYLEMYPTFEELAKGLGKYDEVKKAGPEMMSSLKFQTVKQTISDFLKNQYDAFEAGVDWQTLKPEKNKILAAREDDFKGKTIMVYIAYTLLRDTTTGQSYVIESELDFLDVNVFSGMAVRAFEKATSIEAYLGHKAELKKSSLSPGIGSVTVVNMDEDEPNTEYYDKAYRGSIGKDSAVFIFNYRNEWGSNFIGSAVYQLDGGEPIKMPTDFIDRVCSFYEEKRDILWLVMEAGDILRGVQLSQKGEILDKINMRLKE